MSRKKILWLCSWYPARTAPFNGDFIQRHARAAALYNDIHVVHVTGARGVDEKEEEVSRRPGLTEQVIYYKRSSSLWGKVAANYRLFHFYKQAVRKYIVENGKPDLVHVHVPMKAGLFGIWIKKRYKIPYVLTEHWGIYNDIEVLNYNGRSSLFKKYTRRIFEQAARFISVSRYLAEGVNRLVMKKEYEVIPNVVDTGLFFYHPHNKAPFRFIHVSNMVPLKNAEGILRAFKALLQQGADAALVMVGNTNEDMPRYAASLGLTPAQVQFRGEVPYEQVAREMQVADSLVVFSNIENSPCVIGEALCSGLPVIATNTGGIPELTEPDNSLLVEPKNESQLTTAMQEMMSNSAVYDRKKIAEEAKHRFSYEIVGKKFDEIYTGLLPAT